MQQDKAIRWAMFVLSVALTAIILYVLISTVDVGALFKVFQSISALSLAAMGVLLLAIIMLSARRFQVILRYMGSIVPYDRCFSVNMACYPLILITPSKTGDLVKILFLKNGTTPAKIVSSMIVERIFDLGVLGTLALIFVFFAFESGYVIMIAGMLAAILAFVLVMRRVKLKPRGFATRKIIEVIDALNFVFRNPKASTTIAAYTIALWSLSFLQVFLFFDAVAAHIAFDQVILKSPVAILIGQVPVTLGGMGTRDAAFVYLFGQATGYEKIIAAGLLFSAFRYWIPSLFGIVFTFIENRAYTRSIKPAEE